MKNADKIIVALDIAQMSDLETMLKKLENKVKFVKIGMELFYTFGPSVIQRCKDHGFKIFLDLKMHDIPTTVAKSARSLGKLQVDIINVHAAGGIQMMKAAKESYLEYSPQGKMIAVTQLTSTNQQTLNNELMISTSLENTILRYAENTKEAGLHGVVCSAREVKMIKEKLSTDFLCITPGIRPEFHKASDDQVRTMTPKQAILNGSDYLVIGRPITQASCPAAAVTNILEELV